MKKLSYRRTFSILMAGLSAGMTVTACTGKIQYNVDRNPAKPAPAADQAASSPSSPSAKGEEQGALKTFNCSGYLVSWGRVDKCGKSGSSIDIIVSSLDQGRKSTIYENSNYRVSMTSDRGRINLIGESLDGKKHLGYALADMTARTLQYSGTNSDAGTLVICREKSEEEIFGDSAEKKTEPVDASAETADYLCKGTLSGPNGVDAAKNNGIEMEVRAMPDRKVEQVLLENSSHRVSLTSNGGIVRLSTVAIASGVEVGFGAADVAHSSAIDYSGIDENVVSMVSCRKRK